MLTHFARSRMSLEITYIQLNWSKAFIKAFMIVMINNINDNNNYNNDNIAIMITILQYY